MNSNNLNSWNMIIFFLYIEFNQGFVPAIYKILFKALHHILQIFIWDYF